MTSEVVRGIDTIVVLMMESRSFDHVLGHLSLDGATHSELIDGFSGLPMDGLLAQPTYCDQWFAPLPTGSIPNRLMATCGVSNLVDTPSNLLSCHPTVFEWLKERRVRYRVYHDGLSFFTLCPWMLDEVAGDRFRDPGRIAEDFLSESDETFPQFIFVEPSYFDGPVRSDKETNDNHAPSFMAAGETILLSVYDALRANPERLVAYRLF